MHRDVTEMRRTLHRAILSVATPEKIAKILDKLMEKAAEGDVLAARDVLDRVLGKAKVTMEVQRDQPTVEQLRQRLLAMLNQDPHAMRRTLGPALSPVIESRESGVAR